MIPEALFWASAALVAYVYAGYPALLWALARAFGKPVRKGPVQPAVSVLIPAFNEARVIAEKVRNTLALRYPPELVEIVVASDGSTDGTAEVARRAASGSGDAGRVTVLDFSENRGKLRVLNEVVPKLRGEIVIFTDAASMPEPGALKALISNFADPAVGAVSGVYRVVRQDQAAVGKQEDFYWKYETFLKLQEARLSSILGAHGSLYAIRRSLYPRPEPGTINDDYVIPVRILQQGYRVAYEPAAVAIEEAAEMGGFGRRVRIMAGNIQQLREVGPFVRPLRPAPLFMFLSHKLGRLVAPFAMLAAAAANLALLGSPLYRVTAAAQALFYALAAVGAPFALRPRLLRLPYYFCMINAAVFPGLLHVLAGGARMPWKRSA